MPDLENSRTESLEQLPEPSPARSNSDVFGGLGLREVEQTYDMVVESKRAINNNDHWKGEDLRPMAMLLTMLSNMEVQYRSRVEQLRGEEKDALKRAREEIRKAGGQVNGEATPPAPATTPA